MTYKKITFFKIIGYEVNGCYYTALLRLYVGSRSHHVTPNRRRRNSLRCRLARRPDADGAVVRGGRRLSLPRRLLLASGRLR